MCLLFVYSVVSLKDSVKTRTVSDQSFVGVFENEKQMLEPYAGAACFLCHTNTLDPNWSGWGQERLGQDNLCVCTKKREKLERGNVNPLVFFFFSFFSPRYVEYNKGCGWMWLELKGSDTY